MIKVKKTPKISQKGLKNRLHLTIRGAVQGVGFRPFIYRLATELKLSGWVNNSAQGVFIEVEGDRQVLETFLLRIEREKPPLSLIQSLEASWLDPVGYLSFEIRPSVIGEKTAVVLPDIGICPDCLSEIFDPKNRRYRYPFTNCTNCGPRYTIIEALPYDRTNTTMQGFAMCPECQAEYENPLNRRFHAQPNACAKCGPHVELWDKMGQVLCDRDAALHATVEAIRGGKIVAIKGMGGFHLMVDAGNETAVQQLRRCKRREEKPFALMYPSLDLIKEDCEVTAIEERLLRSPESPIVLLRRREDLNRRGAEIAEEEGREGKIALAVSPGNPYLGVMLPYTPLHHLLLAELGIPVVATSGNLSDEPICIDEREALQRLRGIADLFLIHDRPIVRPVDDSIVRVMAGREMVLRRARGYAPLPIQITNSRNTDCRGGFSRQPFDKADNLSAKPAPLKEEKHSTKAPILAVGGHLKNTIAIALDRQVFISQHIGDLETVPAFEAFQNAIASFKQLYECQPAIVACDAHPDYKSSQFARQLGLPVVTVQHHYAHAIACMAENQLLGETVLAISWDGTGYGLDGTIWGGEFLLVNPSNFQRIAHFRTFRLPGGDKAVKEPRRVALGLLYELWGDKLFETERFYQLPQHFVQAFTREELKVFRAMFQKNINVPITSSVGRLFDGVAAIAGIRQNLSFEGQAAMQLEFALNGITTDEIYPFELIKKTGDWGFGIGEKGLGTGKRGKGAGEQRSRGAREKEELVKQLPITHYRLPITDYPIPNPQSPIPNPQSPIPNPQSPIIIDWAPMIFSILDDVRDRTSVGIISAKFHNTLVEAIAAVAKLIGETRIVLTGGCFQNKYLTETAIRRLQAENFRPYWHQRIPPNDGGISLGQIIAASQALVKE